MGGQIPIACADLLGNGNTDILSAISENEFLYSPDVWLMDGVTVTQSCSFFGQLGLSVQDNWAGVADMDGQGPLDILLWDGAGNFVIWYTSGCGTTRGSASLPRVDPEWGPVATGDFNSDGHVDLLWANYSAGASAPQYAIWLMNDTTLLSGAVYEPGPRWFPMQVADFNGDGKSDILWQNFDSGQVSLWFMNGTAITSNPLLPSVTSGWCAVGADDYDGDGHVDILWYNDNTGEVAVWLMNGSQILQSADIANVPFLRDWRLISRWGMYSYSCSMGR